MTKLAHHDVDYLISEFDANADRFYHSTVESDKEWSSLTLYGIDEETSKTKTTLENSASTDWTPASLLFPKTVAFLKDLDFKYKFIILQKLDPTGKVEMHTDTSDGYDRYFLYIQSPVGFEFEIDGDIKKPSNGDLVVIDPSLPHRAINNSTLPRYQVMFYGDKLVDK